MCVCAPYPKAKVVCHVFKEAAHHGCQMNDVCWAMFLEHSSCLSYIPETGRKLILHNNVNKGSIY